MKKQAGFVLLVLALATQLTRAADSQQEVLSSSEQWLALVDGGKYAESWTAASAFFQSKLTHEQWVGMVKAIRAPLGPLSSNRHVLKVTFRNSLPAFRTAITP